MTAGGRWEALFADLEAQAEVAAAADLSAEVADRTRREVAAIPWLDRARAAVGLAVALGLGAAGTLAGRLVRVGSDWLLLSVPGQVDALVPASAVQWVGGLPALTEPSAGIVASRLTLPYALRGIARDRSAVTLLLRDGSALTGTLDRVGADWVDLAEHAPGEARRTAAVRAGRLVPLVALGAVRPG